MEDLSSDETWRVSMTTHSTEAGCAPGKIAQIWLTTPNNVNQWISLTLTASDARGTRRALERPFSLSPEQLPAVGTVVLATRPLCASARKSYGPSRSLVPDSRDKSLEGSQALPICNQDNRGLG
jgi:hypothetical protein